MEQRAIKRLQRFLPTAKKQRLRLWRKWPGLIIPSVKIIWDGYIYRLLRQRPYACVSCRCSQSINPHKSDPKGTLKIWRPLYHQHFILYTQHNYGFLFLFVGLLGGDKNNFNIQQISIDRSKMSEEEAFEHAIDMIQTRQMGFRKAADFFSVSIQTTIALLLLWILNLFRTGDSNSALVWSLFFSRKNAWWNLVWSLSVCLIFYLAQSSRLIVNTPTWCTTSILTKFILIS